MNNAEVSLVIPTSNMGSDLERLLTSIKFVKESSIFKEIIIVNDGSTDNTSDVIADFRNQNEHLVVKEIKLNPRVGRYLARLKGASSALSENLLFLDTRLELSPGFADSISELIKNYKVVQGTVQIKTDESIYSLYWDRSHRKIFYLHFKDQTQGFYLNVDNFEDYTCGMGIFLCKKEIYLKACHDLAGVPLSDDREVILAICKNHDIWVTQKLSIFWWPRQNLFDFLARLWERGVTFVEYHVFSHQTFLAFPVYLGFIALIANVLCLIYFANAFPLLLVAELFVIGLSTSYFSQNLSEFVKLLPLHVVVVIVFGLGVVKGLLVNTMQLLLRPKV